MKTFKKSMSIALFALSAAGTTNVWAMESQPSNKEITQNCPNLKKLDLSSCDSLTIPNISSNSLKKLCLSGYPELIDTAVQAIAINWPNLTDAAVITIAQNYPNLLELDLSCCPNVTQDCIAELQAQGINVIR